MEPINRTTRLSVNGSTSIVVVPPAPCALAEPCVAELHVTHKHGETTRLHLNNAQRRELIFALGGTLPLSAGAGR